LVGTGKRPIAPKSRRAAPVCGSESALIESAFFAEFSRPFRNFGAHPLIPQPIAVHLSRKPNELRFFLHKSRNKTL
jgi:hypothetical protein